MAQKITAASTIHAEIRDRIQFVPPSLDNGGGVELSGMVVDGPKATLDRDVTFVLTVDQLKLVMEQFAAHPEHVEYVMKLGLAAARANLGHKGSLEPRARIILAPGSSTRAQFIRQHIEENTSEPKQVLKVKARPFAAQREDAADERAEILARRQ